jgi:hypothetical protein
VIIAIVTFFLGGFQRKRRQQLPLPSYVASLVKKKKATIVAIVFFKGGVAEKKATIATNVVTFF